MLCLLTLVLVLGSGCSKASDARGSDAERPDEGIATCDEARANCEVSLEDGTAQLSTGDGPMSVAVDENGPKMDDGSAATLPGFLAVDAEVLSSVAVGGVVNRSYRTASQEEAVALYDGLVSAAEAQGCNQDGLSQQQAQGRDGTGRSTLALCSAGTAQVSATDGVLTVIWQPNDV